MGQSSSSSKSSSSSPSVADGNGPSGGFDLSKAPGQSVEVVPATDGYSPIYRRIWTPLQSCDMPYSATTGNIPANDKSPPRAADIIKGVTDTRSLDAPPVRTIWGALELARDKHNSKPMLGTRVFVLKEGSEGSRRYKVDKDGLPLRGPYVWQSYAEVYNEAMLVGAGLVGLGARKGECVGIYSRNRAEWVIAALGAWSQGLRVAALFATLAESSVEYLIGHSDMTCIFTEKAHVPLLLALASRQRLGKVQIIIQFDVHNLYKNVEDTVVEHVQQARDYGLTLVGMSLCALRGGAGSGLLSLHPPQPEDVAYVMYTSGTTGIAKGVVLTHGAVMAGVGSTMQTTNWGPQDCIVSYMPLAHIFETLGHVVCWLRGTKIGFYQGETRTLVDDWRVLEPTIIPGVPRLFLKLYQKVFSQVKDKNCVLSYYFDKAYNAQCLAIREGRPRIASYDRKIFAPLRERLGLTHVRLAITGAAPCPPYLLDFMRLLFGAVLQGYGMTETVAAISFSDPQDLTIAIGHCGPPAPCLEVRLRDVPEMGYYTHTDEGNAPTGEVQVRGANMFSGYYKDPESTLEVLNPESGWFSTGDIARVNSNGTLSLVDRKKNLFKLAGGELIAAERLEMVYSKCPAVAQIWVYGDETRTACVAVVVPNAEEVYRYCREKEKELKREVWPGSGGSFPSQQSNKQKQNNNKRSNKGNNKNKQKSISEKEKSRKGSTSIKSSFFSRQSSRQGINDILEEDEDSARGSTSREWVKTLDDLDEKMDGENGRDSLGDLPSTTTTTEQIRDVGMERPVRDGEHNNNNALPCTVPGTAEFAHSFHMLMTGEHAPRLRSLVFEAMKLHNVHLRTFERLAGVILEVVVDEQLNGFTETNGCVTPSLKLRRPALKARYAEDIEVLYTSLADPDSIPFSVSSTLPPYDFPSRSSLTTQLPPSSPPPKTPTKSKSMLTMALSPYPGPLSPHLATPGSRAKSSSRPTSPQLTRAPSNEL